MNADDYAALWRQEFGAVAPIGYLCREALPSRWLRIHSLPESKRYADDETEYAELLRRHDEVASTILGNGEECVLFATVYDEHDLAAAELPVIDGVTFTDVPDLATDDEVPIRIAAAPAVWNFARFEELIRAIADDRSCRVLFANFARHTAYAPYDGGADLFLDSPESVSRMKKMWRKWLSARADGL
jgi:hypothetical protein